MNNQLEITLIDNIKESGVEDTVSMVGDFDSRLQNFAVF